MSLQLVTPNDYSALPQLSNPAPQIPHGKSVKSGVNPIPEHAVSNHVDQAAYSTSPASGENSISPGDSLPQARVPVEEVVPMKMKTCVKCKQEKPLLEFHKNSRSSDGLHSYCKDCNRAQALAHIKAEKARKTLARAAKKLAAGKS